VLERIAGLHLGRARLSGDYDDYAKAEAALERAFTVAGKDAGPHLTRIALNFTLHRLDRVAADLERVEKYAIKTPADRRALRELGAELAFQQGRYADARAGFEAALAAEPEDVTNLARMALLRWKTGDFAGAEDLYGQALGKRVEGEPAAWLHLQLGLMDLERGRHDEALAHYRDAAALLAGYWLLDEHIAEILTLQGKTDAALALYADIIARTDNPEFMDAVAGIHRAAGRTEAAAPLIARARRDLRGAAAPLPRGRLRPRPRALPRVRRPEAGRHARRGQPSHAPQRRGQDLAGSRLPAGRTQGRRPQGDRRGPRHPLEHRRPARRRRRGPDRHRRRGRGERAAPPGPRHEPRRPRLTRPTVAAVTFTRPRAIVAP
jgi:tetratricopeptide (TPR) repeat protein